MREEEIKQLELSKERWRNLYWSECEKNKKLSENVGQLEEKIRFLESCLDNKEKVNKELREEIGKLVMKE